MVLTRLANWPSGVQEEDKIFVTIFARPASLVFLLAFKKRLENFNINF